MARRCLALVAATLPFIVDVYGMSMPMVTPVGMFADVGMSPRPTGPPGLPRDIPLELLKRKDPPSNLEIPYPAPGFYCGLVEGDPTNPLTCVNAKANCVYLGTAAGCCTRSNLADCTTMATSCVDYGDDCGSACRRNPKVLSCAISTLPYCGTYFFNRSTRLLGCYNFESVTQTVLPLIDYYSSVLGPGYITKYTEEPTTTYEPTKTATDNGVSHTNQPEGSNDGDNDSGNDGNDDDTGSGGSRRNGSSGVTSGSSGGSKKGGLSGGEIGGAVVGAVAGLAAIAVAAYFFVKKKKGKAGDTTAVNNQLPPSEGAPAPVQQQQPPAPPPPSAGDYYYHHHQEPKAPVNIEQQPSYLYDQKTQSYHQAPNAQEMSAPVAAGGMPQSPSQSQQPQPGHAAEYYNQNRSSVTTGSPIPSELASTPATITTPSGAQMGATHTGPVPEQIYELGTGR